MLKFAGKKLAGGPGFEPGLAESESAVLPLDDPPNLERLFTFIIAIMINSCCNLRILCYVVS